jgi:protein-S-isoprenylcysteine O-methyltransferase Ste14
MWLWVRALFYMLIAGTGWLCILPALLLYWEFGSAAPAARVAPLPLIGLCSIVAGVALAFWGAYYLITFGSGTPLPFDPPRRLVTEGPYRFVRNPQAIAIALMVLGEIFVIESATLWLMLPLTFIYLELVVGPPEKRQLFKDFGADYQNYASRVRKWIPSWQHHRNTDGDHYPRTAVCGRWPHADLTKKLGHP